MKTAEDTARTQIVTVTTATNGSPRNAHEMKGTARRKIDAPLKGRKRNGPAVSGKSQIARKSKAFSQIDPKKSRQ